MKDLKLYLEDIFTTPANTIGMGNPSAPTDTQIGSGEMPITPQCIDVKTGKIYKRKKKFRRYKL